MLFECDTLQLERSLNLILYNMKVFECDTLQHERSLNVMLYNMKGL